MQHLFIMHPFYICVCIGCICLRDANSWEWLQGDRKGHIVREYPIYSGSMNIVNWLKLKPNPLSHAELKTNQYPISLKVTKSLIKVLELTPGCFKTRHLSTSSSWPGGSTLWLISFKVKDILISTLCLPHSVCYTLLCVFLDEVLSHQHVTNTALFHMPTGRTSISNKGMNEPRKMMLLVYPSNNREGKRKIGSLHEMKWPRSSGKQENGDGDHAGF